MFLFEIKKASPSIETFPDFSWGILSSIGSGGTKTWSLFSSNSSTTIASWEALDVFPD